MTVHTTTTIHAKAEIVWAVLTDFDQYLSWNPFIQSIQGEPKVDRTLIVSLEDMTFKPKVVEFSTNRSFAWQGHFLVKGFFDGRHSFTLMEEGNQTHFIHEEKFSGILPKFMRKAFFTKLESKFNEMNSALKERAEKLSSSSL